MPRLARSSMLAVALTLPACSDSSGPERLTIYDCDKGVRYAIGQSISGAITTSDCSDPEDNGLVDFYQFELSSSGPVSIVVERSGGSGFMYVALIGSGDNLVDFAGIAASEEVAVGGQLDAGTYVIAIGGQVPGHNSYALSSSAALPPSGPPFFDCTVAQPYTVGSPVEATLGSGDCVTPDATWMDRYQFSLTSTRTVTIELTSDDFDAYLYLFNSQGTVIAENDDFGESLDSRISLSLPAGTYSIGASSFEAGGQGSYTVQAQ